MAMASVAIAVWRRPMPATVQVQPAGIERAKCRRFSGVAAEAPGTPRTKSKCAGGVSSPFAKRTSAVPSMPSSKISSSGTIPLPRMRSRIVRIVGSEFSKMSSPKLQVPSVSVAMSGLRTSAAMRSSTPMPTAPPVENCWMIGQRDRIAAE